MICLKNLTKVYSNGNIQTQSLNDISLEIKTGEMVAIMGRSGSGKSTLLRILGGLDNASGGTYTFDCMDVTAMNTKKRDMFRKENVGFVFQHFALMQQYTVFENVEVPLIARNVRKKDRTKAVDEVLKKLDIYELRNKCPYQLSGGQQQRTAISRALVTNSRLLLADEPTGALDVATSSDIMEVFKSLHTEDRIIILVTHDINVAAYCDRIIVIEDGRIKE